MKVKELKDNSAVEEITLKIVEKGEPRQVSGGSLSVCNLTGEDSTGKVTVALWNDDIDKVNQGDTIKITKGWCRTYNNVMQISTGKSGTLEVI